MKSSLLAVAAGLSLAFPATALAAGNPCNPCSPKANPCASKANPCNPCAAKSSSGPKAVHKKVSAGTVDPGKVTYTQLRSFNDKEFGTIAGRGMKSGQALMGGVPVGGEAVSLEGQVVDLVCYQSSGLTGGKHALCARVCALKGGPVGLLTRDGKVYQILPDKAGMPVSDAVLDAIATKVHVEGHANSRGGLNTIAITKITEL